jgi:NodT family efflux transporter outer membrane factor (OMF) lipoprotein
MNRYLFKLLLALSFPAAFISCAQSFIERDPTPFVSAESYSEVRQSKNAFMPQVPWWEQFNDQKLNQLMQTALTDNLDLAMASARIDQAKAVAEQAWARQLPFVDLGVISNQTWDKNNDGKVKLDSRHRYGANIDWEVDIFGRLSTNLLARRYEFESLIHQYEFTKLVLSTAIAEAYFGAVEQRQQLELLRKQVDTDQEQLTLTKRRLAGGVAAQVDVLQQEGQIAETKSLIPLAESALRVFENELSVLLGKVPSAENRVSESDIFPLNISLPIIGVPSDLLLNRPELRAKKALLVAADAERASAFSERLPVITISGMIGGVAGSGPTGFAADIVSSILQPVLDWGFRSSVVDEQDAVYRERLLDFTSTYIQAISEVENGFYQFHKQREFLEKLKERGSILEQTVQETQKRYNGGLTDYLPVLAALQQLRVVEREIVRQQKILTLDAVQLYIALGGLPVESSDESK